MKVRVEYTVEVDDEMRREINNWYGRPGLANRQQIQNWYQANGESMDDDLRDIAGRRESGGRDAWDES